MLVLPPQGQSSSVLVVRLAGSVSSRLYVCKSLVGVEDASVKWEPLPYRYSTWYSYKVNRPTGSQVQVSGNRKYDSRGKKRVGFLLGPKSSTASRRVPDHKHCDAKRAPGVECAHAVARD